MLAGRPLQVRFKGSFNAFVEEVVIVAAAFPLGPTTIVVGFIAKEKSPIPSWKVDSVGVSPSVALTAIVYIPNGVEDDVLTTTDIESLRPARIGIDAALNEQELPEGRPLH